MKNAYHNTRAGSVNTSADISAKWLILNLRVADLSRFSETPNEEKNLITNISSYNMKVHLIQFTKNNVAPVEKD